MEHNRLNWDSHIRQLQHEGLFENGTIAVVSRVVRTCRTAAYDALNDFIDAVNMTPEHFLVCNLQGLQTEE
jgi:hypothetical protein